MVRQATSSRHSDVFVLLPHLLYKYKKMNEAQIKIQDTKRDVEHKITGTLEYNHLFDHLS